jgi:hypothetical protein
MMREVRADREEPAMPGMDEELFREVDACVDTLASQLAMLADKYSQLAIAIALTLHVNAGLKAAIATGKCAPEQARALLRQLVELDVDPKALRPRGSRQ